MTAEITDMPARVADYVTVRDWVAVNGGKVFQTFSAVEWFIRRHRAELIRSGQFLPRRGSNGSLVGPQFEGVVLGILRDESLRTLPQEAAA